MGSCSFFASPSVILQTKSTAILSRSYAFSCSVNDSVSLLNKSRALQGMERVSLTMFLSHRFPYSEGFLGVVAKVFTPSMVFAHMWQTRILFGCFHRFFDRAAEITLCYNLISGSPDSSILFHRASAIGFCLPLPDSY